MKINASRQFRYWVIRFVSEDQSRFKSELLRAGIFLTLSILLVPIRVSREIVYGISGTRPDIKSSLRKMLWLWNRSWIPIHHPLNSYYEIGWVLSEGSCQALSDKGYLKRNPLKRQCDKAQYALAGIRAGVESADLEKIDRMDAKVCALVSNVLTEARIWAAVATDAHASIQAQDVSQEPIAEGFNNDSTRTALLEFDDLCKGQGQEYFLVSGTFLGVVRDGGFIGHDNDIDVGVFEDRLVESLLPALQASKNFTVVRVDHICRRIVEGETVRYGFMRDPAIIKVIHRNGVAIDVFNHFYDGDLIWHGTSCQRWDNRHFALAEYDFLDRAFKAAENFDLYFTENYGSNWRIPQPDFDSSADTPNLSFVGSANGLVFFAWTITRFVTENEPSRVQKYIEMLCRLGACRLENNRIRVI